MSEVREYRFSRCRVDVATRELWLGDSRVAIEPKAFDLLVYLIRNRHRAVDKNELQDNIWTGTIVTEAALTRCVMKTRRAIGDDARVPSAIKTVRGHGYRFSVDVTEVREAETPRSGELELPDKPSIAVMPFNAVGGSQQGDYFLDGICEDIITELSRFRSLFVISRHSSFSFRDQSLTAAEIARRLGVSYVVEGSIQCSDRRIRINVRLIEAAQQRPIWSERYDRELEDVLLLQAELAATVAATVGGRVEASRGKRRLNDASLESYDCILKAQALYYEVSRASSQKAQALLERALEVDPDNARAMILLAAVHSMSSWSFWAEDNETARQASLELGARSIALDDTDSLAHALYAEILFDAGEKDKAEHHFRRAISLNPNDIAAHALHASKLCAQGNVSAAAEQIRIAERLDPFGLLWIPWIKGTVMFTARQYDEALQALSSMSHPPNEANYLIAATLARLYRSDEASGYVDRFLDRAKQEMPGYPGRALAAWVPVFRRMIDYSNPADLEHLIESLSLAGWE